ncbi:MAG: hypothetical protein IT299_12225 [Dehalococcoidia bacterium]|nr:hypothetical protein [Dehalococcoidia bacterium]
MRARLVEPRLFLVKTVSVFVLSLALVPLVAMKQQLPAMIYAGGLVVLHIFVLVAYFYRVRFGDLDPDRRSLVARIVALAAVSYLLFVASAFEPGTPIWPMTLQMLGVSILHTLILVLLMVHIERADTRAAGGMRADSSDVRR